MIFDDPLIANHAGAPKASTRVQGVDKVGTDGFRTQQWREGDTIYTYRTKGGRPEVTAIKVSSRATIPKEFAFFGAPANESNLGGWAPGPTAMTFGSETSPGSAKLGIAGGTLTATKNYATVNGTWSDTATRKHPGNASWYDPRLPLADRLVVSWWRKTSPPINDSNPGAGAALADGRIYYQIVGGVQYLYIEGGAPWADGRIFINGMLVAKTGRHVVAACLYYTGATPYLRYLWVPTSQPISSPTTTGMTLSQINLTTGASANLFAVSGAYGPGIPFMRPFFNASGSKFVFSTDGYELYEVDCATSAQSQIRGMFAYNTAYSLVPGREADGMVAGTDISLAHYPLSGSSPTASNITEYSLLGAWYEVDELKALACRNMHRQVNYNSTLHPGAPNQESYSFTADAYRSDFVVNGAFIYPIIGLLTSLNETKSATGFIGEWAASTYDLTPNGKAITNTTGYSPNTVIACDNGAFVFMLYNNPSAPPSRGRAEQLTENSVTTIIDAAEPILTSTSTIPVMYLDFAAAATPVKLTNSSMDHLGQLESSFAIATSRSQAILSLRSPSASTGQVLLVDGGVASDVTSVFADLGDNVFLSGIVCIGTKDYPVTSVIS